MGRRNVALVYHGCYYSIGYGISTREDLTLNHRFIRGYFVGVILMTEPCQILFTVWMALICLCLAVLLSLFVESDDMELLHD